MKKGVFVLVLVLLIFLLPEFFPFLRYDVFGLTHNGPTFSTTLKESKERNVFVNKLNTYSVRINNARYHVEVKDAWIEKLWHRGKWYWDTNPYENSYQIVIVLKNNSVKSFVCQFNGDFDLRCNNGTCIGDSFKTSVIDTLKYNIYLNTQNNLSDETVGGEIVLISVPKQAP